MLRTLLLLAILFAPALLFAATDDETQNQLSTTKEALKASNARAKKIEADRSSLEHELSNLRKETVNIAAENRVIEENLSASEEKLAILEEQKRIKQKTLDSRSAEMSELISAMIKMEAMPPAAIIAMPGKVDETMAAARALSVVTHTIEEDAKSLKNQLTELDELSAKIRKNREVVLNKARELDSKRTELDNKMNERGTLESELNTKSQKEKTLEVSLEAKSRSLEDLVDAIGKESAHYEQEKPSEHEETRHERSDMRSFASARGKIELPAAGKIVRHYSDSGDETALSRGITLETRAGASVVAPYDGEVVYAGNFRDYGRIVIIRHSDDYHTLLSGMGQINCEAGQFLMRGEPVGSMGDDKDARRLYMEVRKSGKPIDPAPWIKS